MGRSKNYVSILGNVGNDPEVRNTAGGNRVATFSVATSREWKDKTTNEKQEKTEWHRCVAWGKLADIVSEYVQKGSKLSIDGRIEYRQWEDKEGVTRYSTEINVSELILLTPSTSKDVSAQAGFAPRPSVLAPVGAKPSALDDETDDLPFS